MYVPPLDEEVDGTLLAVVDNKDVVAFVVSVDDNGVCEVETFDPKTFPQSVNTTKKVSTKQYAVCWYTVHTHLLVLHAKNKIHI